MAYAAHQHSCALFQIPHRRAPEGLRMGVQPEAIKVPVQLHVGQEDSIKGMSDPEGDTSRLSADQELCFLRLSVRMMGTRCH